MLKNKLKNNEGSSMVLVIIAIVLVTMLVGTICMKLNNQIKFNSKTEKHIQSKYESQGGVENGIAKFINSINVTGDLNSNTSAIRDKYMDIVLQYSNEALLINGNQGIAEREIQDIIDEIKALKKSNLPLDKIKEKYNIIDGKIDIAIDRLEGKSNSEKQLVYNELVYAKEYLRILQLDMTNQNSLSNIRYIINRITSNSDLCKQDIDYKEHILDSDIKNHLDNLKNKINDIYQNIGNAINNKDINSMNRYIENINKYDEIMQAIMQRMNEKKESILVNNIKQNYGNGNGNKDFYQIVYKRMETIKLELELLRENILFLKDGIISGVNSSGSGSLNSSNKNKLVVTIPKIIDNITEEDLNYKSKVTVDECKLNSNISITELSKVYQIEVINNTARIDISLSIESKNDNYTTNSKVNIIISNIRDSETYDVKYEVLSWN